MEVKNDNSDSNKILFRIDFIRNGYGIVEKKDYAHASSQKAAKERFDHRPELSGYFQSPYMKWEIVPDEQWIAEHPEQFERYKKHLKNSQEGKETRYQKTERIKNEKETKDRVLCPRCRTKLDKDSDFCKSCGYPSEEMTSGKSWLEKALIEEGE